MINRTLVRIRVIQTLFAYYTDGSKTPSTARKELLKSYNDIYNLYTLLLSFGDELTRYAQQNIEDQIARAKVLHREYVPNRRFTENHAFDALFRTDALRNHLEQQKLVWDSGHNAVIAIYKQLIEQDWYKDYMAADSVSFEDDKRIARMIYSELMPSNPDVESALEEMEIRLDASNWVSDLDIMLSYVVRTIKRMKEGEQVELLPMFDSEDELSFGQDLIRAVIDHRDQYDQLITGHLKNWETERVAFMDKVILYTALAEIIEMPEIALQVSLNEYIEVAKEYSGEKSYQFVNGILNEILQEMKADGSLIKAATLR